jgi:xylulokinase
MQILKEMGLEVKVIRVGNDNLFQSNVFATTIATLMDAKIEMLDCTGAVGAAKASGIAIGVYENIEEALGSTEIVREYHPAKNYEYQKAYELWVEDLKRAL